MSGNILQFKTSLYGRLGTFWNRKFLNPDEPRRVVNAAQDQNPFHGLTATRQLLTGQEWTRVSNLVIRFSPRDVSIHGRDMNARGTLKLDTDGTVLVHRLPDNPSSPENAFGLIVNDDDELLADQTTTPLLLPGSDTLSVVQLELWQRQTRYSLPCPENLRPTRLVSTSGKELVAGIHFFLTGGRLVFHEPPEELFDEGRILAASAMQRTPAIHSYPLWADGVFGTSRHMTMMARGRHSPHVFSRAVAESGGLALMPEAGIVRHVQTLEFPRRRYVFDLFSMETDYDHNPIEEATGLEEGDVLGAGSVFRTAWRNSDSDWWHRRILSGGSVEIPMGHGLGTVFLPDSQVEFRAVESGPEDWHVVADIPGMTETQLTRFWRIVHRQEARSGSYLNSALKLSSTGETRVMNLVDAWFLWYLGERGILFVFSKTHLGSSRIEDMKTYARENCPLGLIPLFNEI